MAKLVSIGYVANLFGVTAQSVRNWVEKGVLKTKKTVGNHRRFDVEEVGKLRGIEPEERETILYSRVSSHDQKEDLKRQTDELKKYCQEQNIEKYEVIEDLGSGINYQKKGLQKLMKKVIFGEVKRIVINYRDRLVRFGSDLIKQICFWKNVEAIVLNKDTNETFESTLVEDIMSIMIVFCSKIYGRRSHKNGQKEQRKNVCEVR